MMARPVRRMSGVNWQSLQRRVWLPQCRVRCISRFERGFDISEGSKPQGLSKLQEASEDRRQQLEAQCYNDSLRGELPILGSLRELPAIESHRRSTSFASNDVAWSERSGKEKEPQASIRPDVLLAMTASKKVRFSNRFLVVWSL